MSWDAQVVELPPSAQNGNQLPREEQMARARHQIRGLASDGMSLGEIVRHVEGSFNEVERDLIWLIATHEVDQAQRLGAPVICG